MVFAKKSFGQHFLRDQSALDKIVAAADIRDSDTVVEIGPGRGALTDRLVAETDKLILVEADKDLLDELGINYPEATIVNGDAAQVNYAELVPEGDWILVGNLPYNAGNAIIRQAFASARPPKHQVVMLQREVGEKMLAKPGDMSLLSVAVQIYSKVERVGTVKPGAFVPPPKVDSIILKLITEPKVADPESVVSVAKLAFAHKRKQMHRTLEEAGVASSADIKSWLSGRGLSEQIRAEDLALEDWIDLAAFFKRKV